jgi:cysteine desulfurase/selenocysteine lyase
MSTTTNLTGLPDLSALEKLANELFSAHPGDLSKKDIPLQKEITPPNYDTLINQANPFNLKDPVTSLPDPDFIGLLPKSVGGIGNNTPSIDQGNGVNLSNPQTSLPDPHFTGNNGIPPSLGGSGISPSGLEKKSSLEHLPYLSEQPYSIDITNVLSSINLSNTSQLPDTSTLGFNESSYYFLSEKKPLSYTEKLSQLKTNAISSNNKEVGFQGLPFDANLIKKDFPILQERVNGRPLIWLDNAATTQKPKHVIERISYFYEHENSNIHRAAHELAARATDAYEGARKKVQTFLNAASINEIVFVRGATEAINLVAKSWGEQNLNVGDEILVSHLEHHANIVPWQQLAAKKGLKLRVIPVDDDGQILLEEYAKLLGPKTRLVSFTQVSNALGTVTPAKQMVEMAHHAGAKVLVDGAQSVSHMRVDVRDLNCDWFVFSGHKVFGPTGIGVVYGKEALLNETQPWQGGGNMIVDVTFEHTTYHNAPGRFEAGTGNIADAVGLGAAIDYVSRIGMDVINQYEHYLLVYATKLLKDVPGLRLIGTAKEKASVLSFVLEGFRTEEVGAVLNQEGIAVRSGHHCAQPILRRFGLESTVRPSLAFYNTCADINVLVETLYRLRSGGYKKIS